MLARTRLAAGALVHWLGRAPRRPETRDPRESAAQLAASEERYRQLADNVSDGIIVHDQGIILFANQSLARLLGTTDPKALVGRALATLTPFEDREAFTMNFLDAAPSGARPVEVRLASRAGPPRVVAMTCMPTEHDGQQATLVFVRERSVRTDEPTVHAAAEELENVW